MSDKEDFIATLQACYFGDKNAFNKIVSVYDNLQQENQQLKEVIEEVKGIIESGLDFDNPQYADECKKELLQILDKVKGELENE